MTANFDAVIKHHVTETGRTNGYISFINPVYVDLSIAERFRHLEKVTITIKTRRKARSLPQNSFYWGYFLQFEIDAFLEFWGEKYDKMQIHEWNKQNFLGDVKVIEKTGEIVRLPGSSKELNTIEFEEKLEDIRQWFRMNFEWEIPYPEQTLMLKV
jgi:hypothetical protein